MRERLEQVDWSRLGHAYGDASDVPRMTRALASPDKAVGDQAWDDLFASVRHQGRVYTATPEVVPFLIELLDEPSVLGQEPTEKTPRSFDLDPSGKYRFAAGESSGKLAAYRVDDKRGRLKKLETYEVGQMAWWVLAVDLPGPADRSGEKPPRKSGDRGGGAGQSAAGRGGLAQWPEGSAPLTSTPLAFQPSPARTSAAP
jgi:hypothetical protein